MIANSNSPYRVADAIAQTLHQHGCTVAFGMPGGEVATLLDGFYHANLPFVLVRHETAGATMAAGAWSSGEPFGLLVTTLGPGIANAVNGLADALQERVPLLVITGVVDQSVRSRYTHQILDHRALLQAVTKGSFEIDAIHPTETLERAIRLACTPPYGPVHLDLSPEIAAQPITESPCTPTQVFPVAQVNPHLLAPLLEQVQTWKRPIVLAGWSAAQTPMEPAIRRLADQGVPIITTYKAKGLLDEHHPSALGAAGLSPLADQALLPLLQAADGVLLLGYDPIEMRQHWLNPFSTEAMVVDCSEWTVDHAMHSVTHRMIGPLADLATHFAAALTGPFWPQAEPLQARTVRRQSFAIREFWGPHQIFDVLQTQLDSQTVVTVDSGAHRILLTQQLCCAIPKQLRQSAGFCTMGVALPLAIGIKIRQPTTHVIAVVGDGGLEMGLGELGTLRDQGLKLTVLVLQDASLALIALKQQQNQLATVGVTLGRTDLATVAQAFGGQGATVRNRQQLEHALLQARTAEVFTLINCEIDATHYRDAF